MQQKKGKGGGGKNGEATPLLKLIQSTLPILTKKVWWLEVCLYTCNLHLSFFVGKAAVCCRFSQLYAHADSQMHVHIHIQIVMTAPSSSAQIGETLESYECSCI